MGTFKYNLGWVFAAIAALLFSYSENSDDPLRILALLSVIVGAALMRKALNDDKYKK